MLQRPAPSALETVEEDAGMGISTIFARSAKGWALSLWRKMLKNAPFATEAGVEPAGMGMNMTCVRSAKERVGLTSTNLSLLINELEDPYQG
jgi:hypothetical protein